MEVPVPDAGAFIGSGPFTGSFASHTDLLKKVVLFKPECAFLSPAFEWWCSD